MVCQLLSSLVTVDFLGTVDWFLGKHFQWSCHDNKVSVHLSQTGFAAHLVEDNNIHTQNINPDATPYHSGLPIDACPESDEADDCPALLGRKKRYQSVVGSIGWLAPSTRPDLSPSHSFLSSYNNKPSKATGTLPSMSSTTFARHSTLDLPSCPRHNFLSTRSC